MSREVVMLPISNLKLHPRNEEFFNDIDGEAFDRLCKSIREDGVLTPIHVTPDMTIISGRQRYRACKEVKETQIPAIIMDDLENDDDVLRHLIAANFGRITNDPIKQMNWLVQYEELRGIKRGGDRKSKRHNVALITQQDIAKELGVDVKTLQRLKQLKNLSPELQEIVSAGRITITAGVQLLSKLTEQEQEQLLSRIPTTKKITQKEVQHYIDQVKGLEDKCALLENERNEIEASEIEAHRLLHASENGQEYESLYERLCAEQQKSRDLYEKYEQTRKELAIALDEKKIPFSNKRESDISFNRELEMDIDAILSKLKRISSNESLDRSIPKNLSLLIVAKLNEIIGYSEKLMDAITKASSQARIA